MLVKEKLWIANHPIYDKSVFEYLIVLINQ